MIEKYKEIAYKRSRDSKQAKDMITELCDLHLVSISLLKKYMSHVMDNESVSFVENANNAWSAVKFTDNELEILKAIHKEITNQY